MDSELAPLRFLVVLKLYHMERLVRYLFSIPFCLTSIVILHVLTKSPLILFPKFAIMLPRFTMECENDRYGEKGGGEKVC